MKTETFFTMSKADELLLEVLVSEPQQEEIPLKGVIQIVHGTREHKERYLSFIRYMNAAGYACIIHDLRGHGKSVRDPGDLGYMYGVGSEGFLSDIHQITRMAKKRWPGLPVILFGHGIGASACICCLKKWEADVSCVILSGAPSSNPMALPGSAASRFFTGSRKRRHSMLLKQIAAFPYDKRFPGENSDFTWLCRNQEAVEEYNKDPLCGFELSADSYGVTLDLLYSSRRRGIRKTSKPDLPILFVGGSDDPYIGGPSPFHQTLRSMRSRGYNNVKGKLYPGLRHEILQEEERELVFSDLVKYLDLVLGTASKESPDKKTAPSAEQTEPSERKTE